jgi:chromosome segregation ATPase
MTKTSETVMPAAPESISMGTLSITIDDAVIKEIDDIAAAINATHPEKKVSRARVAGNMILESLRAIGQDGDVGAALASGQVAAITDERDRLAAEVRQLRDDVATAIAQAVTARDDVERERRDLRDAQAHLLTATESVSWQRQLLEERLNRIADLTAQVETLCADKALLSNSILPLLETSRTQTPRRSFWSTLFGPKE